MSSTGPAPLCREFRLPRRGHTLEECEDASAAASARGRFAIADGAAESFFASLWARLLVEDFVQAAELPLAWTAWLPPLRHRWSSIVQDEVGRGWGGKDTHLGEEDTIPTAHQRAFSLPQRLPSSGAAPMPWYLEDRLNQGAFATFLGLVVENGTWQAFAVGDSCLFQVREGVLVQSFPMACSADFGNAPWLIGSRPSPGEGPRRDTSLSGQGQAGDRLWMMTDALAHWFLRQIEAGGQPWLSLETLLLSPYPEEMFAFWIEELRGARKLRNDDVTLVAVCL